MYWHFFGNHSDHALDSDQAWNKSFTKYKCNWTFVTFPVFYYNVVSDPFQPFPLDIGMPDHKVSCGAF